MPGGIYPAIAFGHVGHTPTTHVKVVFAFIRQLNQALAIDNLQQQFLVVLQVAYIYLALVASIFGALFGAVQGILVNAGTRTNKVYILQGLFVFAQLGTSLGIVEVNLAQTQHNGAINIAFLLPVELAHDGSEDRIVVCFTIRARVAVKRHIGIVGVSLVIVPTAVLEGYGEIEARLAAVELLHDALARTRCKVVVA